MLDGGAGDDVLMGLDGYDDLRGGEGDDALHGGGGANVLQGGEGTDAAVFAGARTDHEIVAYRNWLSVSGPSGTSRVFRDVEILRFADGDAATAGFVSETEPTRRIGEAGILAATQAGPDAWTRVTFDGRIHNAVVVMGPPGSSDHDPATVRVRKVTSDGFEFQLDEWDYQDGVHGTETVSWLAIEAGTHRLADGRSISAGTGRSDEGGAEAVFAVPFEDAPVVLTQLASFAGPAAATVRVGKVGPDGFAFRLQEEQGADQTHAVETVNWIAVEDGLDPASGLAAGRLDVREYGSDLDFGGSFAEAPALLAGLQTSRGGDPVALRGMSVGTTGARVRLEEEQSADGETTHGREEAGFLALPEGNLLAMEAATPETAWTALQGGELRFAQSGPDAWMHVAFDAPIRDAVVVASLSSIGIEPAMVRIDNVTDMGFDVQIDEWDHLNGVHARETISWMAVSEGVHVLADGRTLAAGSAEGSSAFAETAFGTRFDAAPVVLTQLASYEDPAAATVRLRSVAADHFSFRLQEEEAADDVHGSEQIDWIAMETGLDPAAGFAAGKAWLGHADGVLGFGGAFDAEPVVLGGMQTSRGGDPAVLRLRGESASSATAWLQEEASADREQVHAFEASGFLALEAGYQFI